MSDGVVGRWLTSRKNLAGMTGALVGVGLAFADVSAWPVVAVGLYGVGALLAPSDPPTAEPQLTEALRSDAADLAVRLDREARKLPAGAPAAVTRILTVLALVLDRLDEVADQPVDRAAAPERLATAAEIIRVDLPGCLDTFGGRSPSTSRPGRPGAGQAAGRDRRGGRPAGGRGAGRARAAGRGAHPRPAPPARRARLSRRHDHAR